MWDILYTAVPIEAILEEKNENDFNYQQINYKGINMQVEPIDLHKFKIIRIFSTDPQVFLNPDYKPGSIISL